MHGLLLYMYLFIVTYCTVYTVPTSVVLQPENNQKRQAEETEQVKSMNGMYMITIIGRKQFDNLKWLSSTSMH